MALLEFGGFGENRTLISSLKRRVSEPLEDKPILILVRPVRFELTPTRVKAEYKVREYYSKSPVDKFLNYVILF